MEDQGISVDASGAFVSTRRVLAHEITHAVMFRILGQYATRLPLWAHEGTAKYESEKYTDTDKALIGEAAANGTLIPLRDLQERFPKDRSGLAYAESASAIRFLLETYGEDSLGKLFEELAQTGSFESAMIGATGMNPDEFADAWLENVAEHYRMVRLVKIAAGIGGGVMSLLVVIAFFVRRRQKTKAAQRWEAEEWKTDDFEEALRRQRGNDWWR